MTYKGIVRGKIIELEAPLPYPDGTEVEVTVKVDKKAEILRFAGMLSHLSEEEWENLRKLLSKRLSFKRTEAP